MATILVIDDDADLTGVLRAALEDEGHTVRSALGADALVLAQNDDVDLILLDLMMPLMSGGIMAGYLHEHPATGRIPIILITGLDGVGASARELGIRWVLRKPFDLDMLLDLVAKALAAGK